jgi:hypothetical protein
MEVVIEKNQLKSSKYESYLELVDASFNNKWMPFGSILLLIMLIVQG